MSCGVQGDIRKLENDVHFMRLSPNGLYITYEDCDTLIEALELGLSDNKDLKAEKIKI